MTNTTHPPRRRTVLAVLAAAVAAAAGTAAVVLLPGDPASAAVLTAAAQTRGFDSLRSALTAGTSSSTGEFAGDDSKIVYNDAGLLTTMVEVGGVRYSFEGDSTRASREPIDREEPRRAPIARSAADVVRALVDDRNVTEVGHDTIRGTSATHYRVAVSAATRRNLTAVADTKRVWFELEQVDTLRTVDVWVADKLIRRIAVQPDSAKQVVVDFFDFGAPITIRAPRT